MSKDIIKLDQLIRIAEDVPWETFEAMPDGRLLLQDRAQTLVPDEEDTSPLLWVFEMRVGLHFERPMQAIMSCGQFIRMRSTSVYENCTLGKLDPEHPGACLYQYPVPPQQQWQMMPPASSWRPTPPQYASAQQNLQGLSGGQSMWTQGSGGWSGGASCSQNTACLHNQTVTTTTNMSTPQQGTLSKLAGALGVKI